MKPSRITKIEGVAENEKLVGLASQIICSYVTNNLVANGELPKLIDDVHDALAKVANKSSKSSGEALKPAVSVRRSITPDYLICLEDGQKFKSLKRHLRSKYNLSADEYREKWQLPSNYPMVAPNYAAMRSELATKMGLGQKKSRK